MALLLPSLTLHSAVWPIDPQSRSWSGCPTMEGPSAAVPAGAGSAAAAMAASASVSPGGSSKPGVTSDIWGAAVRGSTKANLRHYATHIQKLALAGRAVRTHMTMANKSLTQTSVCPTVQQHISASRKAQKRWQLQSVVVYRSAGRTQRAAQCQLPARPASALQPQPC